jgi:O-acetyl-ADP-ribose deacetylase (regulator of RNase III)
MKEIKGDLWYQNVNAICITTNGILKANGCGVMGAGVALQTKKKYKDIDHELGKHIRKRGNIPGILYYDDIMHYFIWSFPTKNHWRDKSSLKLIEQSSELMVENADYNQYKSIVLTRPGCDYGGLKWSEVKRVIEPILDDRFYIITPL